MQLLLATNSPIPHPGYIVTESTKRDFFEIFGEELKDRGVFDLIYSPWVTKVIYNYFSQDEVKRTIYPLKSAISSKPELAGKIYPKSNIITKKTLIDAAVKFDDALFYGVFKSKAHYDYILSALPTSDSELVICDVGTINTHSTRKAQGPGFYILRGGEAVPANNYSNSVWSLIHHGIVEVFGNLNAKKIHLKDKTDTSVSSTVSLSEELSALPLELGINLKAKCSYEICCEMNGTLDTYKASQALHKLEMFSALQLLAQQMIDNPTHLKKVAQNVQLDISFGVGIKLLTMLQGSFEGGYTREFDLEIQF